MVPPGGFSRGGQFERERVVPPLSRLLCFLSCRRKKGRPRWQALVESRLKNRLKGYKRVTMTTSKYQPKSKPLAYRPLAPSVTAIAVPAPSRRELWGANLSTLACCYGEVPAVESLSQKSKIFASSHRPGALRPVAADNAHGSFLLLVTSLTRPVSFYGAIPGFFRLSIDSVGKKCS